MDIIGILPLEVSLHILSFLTVNDLAKCFFVSKRWFYIANNDCLWRRHCIVRKIRPSICHETKQGWFCKWASVYRTFARKLYNWENDVSHFYELEVPETFPSHKITFGYFTVVLYAYSSIALIQNLVFYQLHEDHIEREDSINLELSGGNSRPLVQIMTNDIYTLASRDNFILCFKTVGTSRKLFLVICVNGSLLEYATTDFNGFTDLKRVSSRDLNIVMLCDVYVWVKDNHNVVHVFDLETHICERIQAMEEYKSMNGLVAGWSDRTVNIYSPNGNIVQNLLPEKMISEIYFNKNAVATLHNCCRDHNRYIQTYDMNTGGMLIQKHLMKYSDITIHHACNHIFVLERTSRDLYRVSSVCAQTGITLWHISLPNVFYKIPEPAVLSAVSNKHLFVFPSHNSTEKYSVFDCIEGKHLYKSSLPGITSSIDLKQLPEGVCVYFKNGTIQFKSFL